MIAPNLARQKYTALNWFTALIMAGFHVGAIAALFSFSWSALAVAVALYYISLSLGIGMGYHRLHTHRGYKVPKFIEYFLAICGTLALEGGPIFWVAVHRIHHQFSDQPGDPHTPREGRFWAHIGWMLFGEALHNQTQLMSKYAPDLAREPFYVWLTRLHWVPITLLGFVLLAIGGWQWVLWGIFLRTTVGLHMTWAVNSATHLWGNRRFETRDDSRNNWLVALMTFGEGWHNNHHAHPVSARHGLAWYELDITWFGIQTLKGLGLATNVKAASISVPAERLKAA